jgi:hypothetical protein
MHTHVAACGSGEITQEEYDAERERLLGKKTPSGAGGGDVRYWLRLTRAASHSRCVSESLPSSFMLP